MGWQVIDPFSFIGVFFSVENCIWSRRFLFTDWSNSDTSGKTTHWATSVSSTVWWKKVLRNSSDPASCFFHIMNQQGCRLAEKTCSWTAVFILLLYGVSSISFINFICPCFSPESFVSSFSLFPNVFLVIFLDTVNAGYWK